jgi:hypothetical protein
MSLSDFVSFLKVFTPGVGPANSNDSRRQVLTRLKFIGRLQPHDKIDSRTLRIESNSIITPLKRLFVTGDSRETTLNFFSSTIDRSFEIIAGHINSKNVADRIFCANVIQDLIASVKGLRATQGTYADDNYTVCEIDVIVQAVQAKIWETQQAYPELFTMKELCMAQIDKETDDQATQPIIPFAGNFSSEELNKLNTGSPKTKNVRAVIAAPNNSRISAPIAQGIGKSGTVFSPIKTFVPEPRPLATLVEDEEYESDGDRSSVDIKPQTNEDN